MAEETATNWSEKKFFERILALLPWQWAIIK
jgi:hypothetical protein